MRGQHFNIVGGMAIWEKGIERCRCCYGPSRNYAFFRSSLPWPNESDSIFSSKNNENKKLSELIDPHKIILK